jgi:hypothetical protein
MAASLSSALSALRVQLFSLKAANAVRAGRYSIGFCKFQVKGSLSDSRSQARQESGHAAPLGFAGLWSFILNDITK